MSNVPDNRPKYEKWKAEQIITERGLPLDKCYLIGIRGYYKQSMGNASSNDRGIYDDAILIVAPNYYRTFTANCDPSVYRTGIANLVAGVWDYKIGIHGLSKPKAQQYKALVQAGKVSVKRDNTKTESGWFGINIHRGSLKSTSSLGCQTIYPTQWNEFIGTVEGLMANNNQSTIKYILVEL